jgi:hypothetical protein
MAATLTTPVDFNGINGATTFGSLIADANGNLFGRTTVGIVGSGNVFELVKTGGSYTLQTLKGSVGT